MNRNYDIQVHAKEYDLLYQEKDVGEERVGMLYNSRHVYTFFGLPKECEDLLHGIVYASEDRYDEWDVLIEYPNCEVVIFITECQFYRETRITQIVHGKGYCSYMFTDLQGNVLQLKERYHV